MSSFAPNPTPKRAHNFSAGPACLPPAVLLEAQQEMMSYQDSGMSFMEMSHRDANGPVQGTLSRAVDLVRELLDVPSNYHIIFQHGGAHAQFSSVPMSLAYESGKIDFVNSGAWGQKAELEARKYADTHVCTTFKTGVTNPTQWSYRRDAAYIHVCLNETMSGIELLDDPQLPSDAPPLVADATSTLFSRPINVSRYGVIYASAGKNFGPAGVCLVIIRSDLLERTAHPLLPSILDHRTAVSSKPIPSIYNTPPCFQLYMSVKVWELMAKAGGVAHMEQKAKLRSGKIYKIFDNSNGFYVNVVEVASRSRMNMCFRIRNAGETEATTQEELAAVSASVLLEKKFVDESEAAGLFQLFGHPIYGGLRVTIYNGQTDAAVEAVAHYLVAFQERYANLHG